MKKKNLRQILIPAFIITACIPITIFTVISQARLKKSTLDNMNNQAEADLQKSNQCLNMTLDKYETILYDITTAEDFLNLAVTAKESADITKLFIIFSFSTGIPTFFTIFANLFFSSIIIFSTSKYS